MVVIETHSRHQGKDLCSWRSGAFEFSEKEEFDQNSKRCAGVCGWCDVPLSATQDRLNTLTAMAAVLTMGR